MTRVMAVACCGRLLKPKAWGNWEIWRGEEEDVVRPCSGPACHPH